ncbi:MAG: phosphatidate cytidylyltransferase [Ruminococcus sp.]|nr:phosphatidate cytidylyltransferase [Ruminococcus sp.]
MLTRIISGAVGVLILAAVLFFHDTLVLPIAVSVMIGIMLFELLRAVKLEKNIPILIASELCGIAMPLIYMNYPKPLVSPKLFGIQQITEDGTWIFSNERITLAAFAVTLAAAFVIFLTWLRHHKEIRYEQVFFALAVMVLVPQAMSCIVRIHGSSDEDGLFLLIMGLCGAWIADTGAYFSGVALGKHKLCPEISPKKTVEGFIGGILTTGIVFAVAFCVRGGFSPVTAAVSFITGAVCAVVGTIGDLSASMVKRQIGFKDYGKIMPGHGGMMDRFDSVLFVLPTFYVFIELTVKA